MKKNHILNQNTLMGIQDPYNISMMINVVYKHFN